LRERAGVPLARGVLPVGTVPVVAVAAAPAHPGDAVLLLTRRAPSPAQITSLEPEPAAPIAGPTPSDQAEQWYRATLPAVEPGRPLDYRVELVRAGRRLATLPADGSWLTVIGGPPPAGAAPRWDCELDFFGTLSVAGRLDVIGATPDGYRVNFLVDAGTIAGPGIEGVVRPGGGDWVCVRPDGVASLEIRATCETLDGAVIFYRAGGLLDLGPDGYDRMAAGRFEGEPRFHATPTFVTADRRWQWLNRVQGFAVGRVLLQQRRVDYDVYLPRVGGRRPGD
jgi:hypothetical protein